MQLLQLVNQPWNLKTAVCSFTVLYDSSLSACISSIASCSSLLSHFPLSLNDVFSCLSFFWFFFSSIPLLQLPFSFQPPFSSTQLPLPPDVFGNTYEPIIKLLKGYLSKEDSLVCCAQDHETSQHLSQL